MSKDQLWKLKRYYEKVISDYYSTDEIDPDVANRIVNGLTRFMNIAEQQQQEIEQLQDLANELNNELFSERMTIDKLEWQLQQAQKRIQHLENELRNRGYSDTDLDNDFLWEFQDKQVGWEEE